jgi:hypothetical protein
MKYLLMLVILISVSCSDDNPAPNPTSSPDIVKGPHFGKCYTKEEGAALGIEANCDVCTCIEDVHGSTHRKDPHCHSSPDKCD